MYQELKAMEMERRRKVAPEALEIQKVMEERMRLERIKQDQLKKERLQWEMTVEEELKRYTFRALDEEQEEVELYCPLTEGDKAKPACWDGKTTTTTLDSDPVGENTDPGSSVYSLFVAKQRYKSEGLYRISYIPLHFSFLYKCKLLSSFLSKENPQTPTEGARVRNPSSHQRSSTYRFFCKIFCCQTITLKDFLQTETAS